MSNRIYAQLLRGLPSPSMATVLGLGALSLGTAQAQQNVPQATAFRDLYSDTWVATDALGRQLPTAAAVPTPRQDRYVGMFYFLWHGQHGKTGPYDITKIIADPANHPWGGPGAFHWWGEPAVGYFLADDPWVHRKNLHMLADAGVDVLFFDVTNAFTYPDIYKGVCKIAAEMRQAGDPTPQIAFITHAGPGKTVTQLYNDFYAKGLYKDLWFQWDGKPLILGNKNGKMDGDASMDPKVVDFFTWRNSWAWDPGQDKWQWIDKYPQRAGWHDDPKVPEEVPVNVAGHPVDSLGRSYHSDEKWGQGTEPPVDEHGMVADTDKGLQFQQQWDQARKIDPKFVFVTGWNEWVAQRFVRGASGPGQIAGRALHKGDNFFVDQYNEEFSRDIMPMKGGYGDDYYMQLVDNIRRFKGARPIPVAHAFATPTGAANFTAWNAVIPEYRDTIGDTTHRDFAGWAALRYKNETGRNDITTAKVACDARHIYFYVRTKDALTPATDPNWMQLLIDTDQNAQTGWHGYDFVINMTRLNAKQTTVAQWRNGGWYRVGRAAFAARGNELQITVPRALLGKTDTSKTAFDFHWLDGVVVGGDVADWWYNGDSAPDGRFNYRYLNSHGKSEPY